MEELWRWTTKPIPRRRQSPRWRTAALLRVFGGEGTPNDVGDMASTYGCDVVVVVPQDKAWDRDPFAGSTEYQLAEARDGRWRIYVRAK